MPTVLSEQIKILAQLQQIDSRIYELKNELSAQPDFQKNADIDYEKKKTNLKTAEDDYKAVQVKQKSLELDLASKEEKVKKLQTQLYTLKTNKEYQMMEMEIKGLKADDSLIEEDILNAYDAIELAKAKVAKEKESLVAEEKIYKSLLEEIKRKSAELEALISAEDVKRKVYLPNIDAKILAQYEKLLKGRDGLAIAPVWNNACGGCHVGLPPQVVEEAHKKEKLINCESCARILYWHD